MSVTPIPAALKRAVYERDQWRCQKCRTYIRYADKRLHHRVPERYGGATTLENLELQCDPCHLALHAEAGAFDAHIDRARKDQEEHEARMAGDVPRRAGRP